jgi:hypothetical protein
MAGTRVRLVAAYTRAGARGRVGDSSQRYYTIRVLLVFYHLVPAVSNKRVCGKHTENMYTVSYCVYKRGMGPGGGRWAHCEGSVTPEAALCNTICEGSISP